MTTRKTRIFSGVQPSGSLTIANYIGALRQWVALLDNADCLFCVVDLHALTVPHDPLTLRMKSREVAALYIAAGINPDKAIIFIQSHVSAHAELGWLLTTQTSLGWLQRMTQFKDKAARLGGEGHESIGAGLLVYPTLMAADILLYQADAVPVGDDQRQHLELTRDLAQRFNHRYGETFVVPTTMTPPVGARIMGLDDPLAKMSKSEGVEGHAIRLLDAPDVARKKIMRAVTDSGKDITFNEDPARAGVNNLLTIYQALTGQPRGEIETSFADARGYGDLKRAVADVVVDALMPLQDRYHAIMRDPKTLDEILAAGASRARAVADQTLARARDALGLLPLWG